MIATGEKGEYHKFFLGIRGECGLDKIDVSYAFGQNEYIRAVRQYLLAGNIIKKRDFVILPMALIFLLSVLFYSHFNQWVLLLTLLCLASVLLICYLFFFKPWRDYNINLELRTGMQLSFTEEGITLPLVKISDTVPPQEDEPSAAKPPQDQPLQETASAAAESGDTQAAQEANSAPAETEVKQPSLKAESTPAETEDTQAAQKAESAPAETEVKQPSPKAESTPAETEDTQAAQEANSAPAETEVKQPSPKAESTPAETEDTQAAQKADSAPAETEVKQPHSSDNTVPTEAESSPPPENEATLAPKESDSEPTEEDTRLPNIKNLLPKKALAAFSKPDSSNKNESLLKFRKKHLSYLGWDMFAEAWENREFFFLIRQPHKYYIVPKRSFANQEELQYFLRMLYRRVGIVEVVGPYPPGRF